MGELYDFSEFSRLMSFERIWAFERAHAEDELEDCEEPGGAPVPTTTLE
jgi:hypothetical protein